MPEVGRYVTYADAARRLGVTRQAVWQLVQRGRLGTVEVRGRCYVNAASVEDRLEQTLRRGVRRLRASLRRAR